MPATTEVDLEPRGKVAGGVGRRQADVAEMAGAVARGDVRGPAECDGQMSEVTADSLTLLIGLGSRPRRAGELVSELDVSMTEVADRLDADQPGGVAPKRSQARSSSRSLSQKRLGNRKTSAFSGSCSTGISCASGVIGSSAPESFTMASEEIDIRPGGATKRVHQLPKPSRYPEMGTEGSSRMWSGATRSETRVKCTFKAAMIGVLVAGTRTEARSRPSIAWFFSSRGGSSMRGSSMRGSSMKGPPAPWTR